MPKKGKEGDEKLEGAARFGRAKGTLKMGLVGLPNVGKSSLFNLLTQQTVAAENYPFCTIDPTEARCPVPDKRFDWLVDLYKAPSNIPSFLMCTDIAGLIKGASEGAGLGNAFLSTIGACDGVYHVVRAFENEEVLHVDETVDPVRDMEIIHGELCAKDMQFIDKAIEEEAEKVKKGRSTSYKTPEAFTSAFDKCKKYLAELQPLRDQDFTTEEIQQINDNCTNALITTKPMIYVVNISEKSITTSKNKFLPKIQDWVKEHGGGLIIPFSVEFEEQVWGLRDDPAAQAEYTKGKEASLRLNKIVKQGFKQLNLMNFFTVGADEVRSWTVYSGATAPQCAGVIHTDFEKGFIKAEVCGYDDYKALTTKPSDAEVKAAGKYRQEGKTYVFVDGDITHFQFNVTDAKKK